MTLLRGLTAGLLGGLLYATTSYCLITPYMRHNVFAIGAFGVRGFLFSAYFLFFRSLLQKRAKQSNTILLYAMIGCASGFLSPVFDLLITYSNFLTASSGNPPPMMQATLLINLVLIALGYSVIGTSVGVAVAHFHLAKKAK